MGRGSNIEWCDDTWNLLAGCTPDDDDCRNCYAAKDAVRLAKNPNPKIAEKYQGTARMTGDGPNRRAVFTGQVNLAEHTLDLPLRWTEPRRIFVNSMSDVFHPEVPDLWVDLHFAVMFLSWWHTHLLLTKRAERCALYLADPATEVRVRELARDLVESGRVQASARAREALEEGATPWPLPNVHVGTSCGFQRGVRRVNALREVNAAVRWVSFEPLIGRVDVDLTGYHGVVIGGESGPNARPMHPEWVDVLIREAERVGATVFVKQWGEWTPHLQEDVPDTSMLVYPGGHATGGDSGQPLTVYRLGKKKAGRLHRGRLWDDWPGKNAEPELAES